MKKITRKLVRIKLFCLLAVTCTVVYACAEPPAVFNGEFLERKLAQPYIIEGILTQGGERYEVAIDGGGSLGSGDFTIKFLSGDVTEGLTVEFFETGVFLFFDDFRFKTNRDTFTNLESLKNSFAILSAAHIEKYIKDLAPIDGMDLIEIGVESESGTVRAHINQLDGSIVRLATTLNGADIILDVLRFENIIKESETEAEYKIEVFDD